MFFQCIACFPRVEATSSSWWYFGSLALASLHLIGWFTLQYFVLRTIIRRFRVRYLGLRNEEIEAPKYLLYSIMKFRLAFFSCFIHDPREPLKTRRQYLIWDGQLRCIHPHTIRRIAYSINTLLVTSFSLSSGTEINHGLTQHHCTP